MCNFAISKVCTIRHSGIVPFICICHLLRLSTRRAFGAATRHQRRMGGHKTRTYRQAFTWRFVQDSLKLRKL